MTNTIASYGIKLITDVKRFMAQTPEYFGQDKKNNFVSHFSNFSSKNVVNY